MILNEGLDLLIEELLEESAKTDFINKFGEDTFNKFEKAKQRLKNNGYSTDYQQYLKMSEEELINFLASLYTKKEDAYAFTLKIAFLISGTPAIHGA